MGVVDLWRWSIREILLYLQCMHRGGSILCSSMAWSQHQRMPFLLNGTFCLDRYSNPQYIYHSETSVLTFSLSRRPDSIAILTPLEVSAFHYTMEMANNNDGVVLFCFDLDLVRRINNWIPKFFFKFAGNGRVRRAGRRPVVWRHQAEFANTNQCSGVTYSVQYRSRKCESRCLKSDTFSYSYS